MTSPPADSDGHRWDFKARFRRHAFGWRSQPAIERVKQAVSEIKRVARREPVLAASARGLQGVTTPNDDHEILLPRHQDRLSGASHPPDVL